MISKTSVALNTEINSFMEVEKLTLSKTKSHVIHIGSNAKPCHELKVHDKVMDTSDNEKYLGDKIDKSGKIRATILDRKSKGYGCVSQIIAITDEAPLGRWRVQSAMLMRNAMLVNSMLFNSEAWQGIVKDDIQQLTRVDQSLFKQLFSSHSKTPTEAHFLEAGQIPLPFIWASRRILYLQTILKRDATEITRQIYETQKRDTTKGDFAQLVNEDCDNIHLDLNEEVISKLEKHEFKKIVKSKIKVAAFNYLKCLQAEHSKIRDIKYEKLEMQPYMNSPDMNAEDIALMFALRTRCIRNIRADFSGMFPNILCPLCGKHDDKLENVSACEHLTHVPKNGANYSDVFTKSVQFQKLTMQQMRALLEERERILQLRAEAEAEKQG